MCGQSRSDSSHPTRKSKSLQDDASKFWGGRRIRPMCGVFKTLLISKDRHDGAEIANKMCGQSRSDSSHPTWKSKSLQDVASKFWGGRQQNVWPLQIWFQSSNLKIEIARRRCQKILRRPSHSPECGVLKTLLISKNRHDGAEIASNMCWPKWIKRIKQQHRDFCVVDSL